MINYEKLEGQSTTKFGEKPLLERRHVSAPLLGHHQVSKIILRGNYVGGRVTVHVIKQRDLVITFVAKIPRVFTKHLTIKVQNLLSTKIYKLNLKKT
jgi:hypothetical protein